MQEEADVGPDHGHLVAFWDCLDSAQKLKILTVCKTELDGLLLDERDVELLRAAFSAIDESERLVTAISILKDSPSITYCAQRLTLRFVDILTYPKPAVKFTLVLDHNLTLRMLREMLNMEVRLNAVNSVVLLTKGKEIPLENDHLTLRQLGLKPNAQIIISKRLGKVEEAEEAVSERNKQFVGDLLFGGSLSNLGNGADRSTVVRAYTATHGYQILGQIIERIVCQRISDLYEHERRARESEAELFRILELEESSRSEEEQKKRKKNKKKKEREKRRKEHAPCLLPPSVNDVHTHNISATRSTDEPLVTRTHKVTLSEHSGECLAQPNVPQAGLAKGNISVSKGQRKPSVKHEHTQKRVGPPAQSQAQQPTGLLVTFCEKTDLEGSSLQVADSSVNNGTAPPTLSGCLSATSPAVPSTTPAQTSSVEAGAESVPCPSCSTYLHLSHRFCFNCGHHLGASGCDSLSHDQAVTLGNSTQPGLVQDVNFPPFQVPVAPPAVFGSAAYELFSPHSHQCTPLDPTHARPEHQDSFDQAAPGVGSPYTRTHAPAGYVAPAFGAEPGHLFARSQGLLELSPGAEAATFALNADDSRVHSHDPPANAMDRHAFEASSGAETGRLPFFQQLGNRER